MRNALTRFALITALGSASTCFAGQATFTLLETAYAWDVTVDQFGRTLVLTNGPSYISPTYIYDSGRYGYIGDTAPYGISDDGTTVAATILNGGGVQEAARVTVGGGVQPLGGLSTCDSFLSNGFGASGDGSVIVGLSFESCSGRAFAWTADTGMQALENLGNGENRASAVSADGQVAVGFAQGTFRRTPAVWNTSDGSGWLFDVDAQGELWAVTPDGGTVAGRIGGTDDVPDLPAFYWNAAEGIVPIGWLDDDGVAMARDITPDGNTIVGYSGGTFIGNDAFIWTRQHGMEKLKDRLVELGATGLDELVLEQAWGVTDDGRTIVGYAYGPGPSGEPPAVRAFIATLPEPAPCAADFDGDGQVGFTDLTQLLGTWGPCPACPQDLDGDDLVGFTDLTQLLGMWGPCA